MPSEARPAAKVTACCSAMPTSKERLGNGSPNRLSPVPDGIAAVIATMRSSFSASLISDLAKTLVYEGAFELGDAVPFVVGLLGREVPVALLGHDMDEDRPGFGAVADVLQDRQQMIDIVPVDRADIVEAQFLKQGPAGDKAA